MYSFSGRFPMIECIGQRVVVRNDRGAQYRGVLRAIMPNGDVIMTVEEIRLTGRGTWQVLKKVENQVITGPTLEDTNG